jgi:hypothetical protein
LGFGQSKLKTIRPLKFLKKLIVKVLNTAKQADKLSPKCDGN